MEPVAALGDRRSEATGRRRRVPALHEINPRLVYCSCPAYPAGHRLAQRPGYDALVQASSGQQWEQPGWRPGPIFLHMPMPSMGAMFLVPTGIISALIARESTGRGQHVRTSLFQGALLYTTQIWTWVPGADSAFYGTMAKTYPPGVHQEMIFEVAGNQYVHASIMSGLAPVKTQDAILGLPDPSDPEKYMMLSPEERAELTPKRWVPAANRIRSWWPTGWWPRSMIRCWVTPRRWECRSISRGRRARSRGRGRNRAGTTVRSSASSATPTPRSRRSVR